MLRTIERDRPLGRLRMWSDGHWPRSHGSDGGIAVEWFRPAGHVTFYALLGGRLSSRISCIESDDDGPRFDDALVGGADEVRLGLPSYARQAVLDGLESTVTTGACEITLAANGLAGSSPIAFGLVARVLVRMLVEPTVLAAGDDELWRLTDECSRAAGGPLQG